MNSEDLFGEISPEPEPADLARPCPLCGHHTLFRPEGWIEGGPVACANPYCESNYPAASELICEECGDDLAAEGQLYCSDCLERLTEEDRMRNDPDAQ